MSSGRLAAVDLTAATPTEIYLVPGSVLVTVNVSICNRNNDSVLVRLAHVDGLLADLNNADYLEYDYDLPANESMERTAIVMRAGHTIVAESDTANVNVVIWGMENGV